MIANGYHAFHAFLGNWPLYSTKEENNAENICILSIKVIIIPKSTEAIRMYKLYERENKTLLPLLLVQTHCGTNIMLKYNTNMF